MEDYLVIGRIGEGAHGVVMKGRHKQSERIVALKKVLLKRLEDGIPATALREIKALQVCWYMEWLRYAINSKYRLMVKTEKSINIDYKIFNETLLKYILKFIPQQMLL